MLPKFPEFKRLELSDREDIEKITSKYQPYSDFNFESLWAWDIKNVAEICELNGNLVLTYNNHLTDKDEFSYLGDREVNDTLSQLFEFFDKSKIIDSNSNLVPEISLLNIDFKKYFIEINLDFCEYVYDLRKLSKLAGNGYIKKRGKANNFVRNYPNAEVRVLNLHNGDQKREVFKLNEFWVQNRNKADSDIDSKKELSALRKFLEADSKNIICVGVYDNDLIGYSIFSFEPNQYVISHFTKADINYTGVYEYLMRESALILEEKGYKFLNYQEDLGLPGLRVSKSSYRPVGFLRKYVVKRY